MDNGQTICKNRTLTHNLQKTAQETKPLSPKHSPGNLPAMRLAGSQMATSSNNPGS